MPENILDQVHAIEHEADQVVQQAHDQAARHEADADNRIKQLQDDLDQKLTEQVEQFKQQTATARESEEATLRSKAAKALEQVRGINADEATTLIDAIVDRIRGSYGH